MSARSVVAVAATQDRDEHSAGPLQACSAASARALNSKGTGTGRAVLQMCALKCEMEAQGM